MPMGIVSDSEFDLEIQKNGSREKSNSVPETIEAEIIDIQKPGRKEGDVNVPNGLRNLIADSAITDGRPDAIKLAQMFGISPSSVSAYSDGAKSTATYNDRPNKPIVDEARERIIRRARNKLSLALKSLTEDKLEKASARDVAGVAKDMSVVIKNIEPDKEDNSEKSGGPTFVIYSPQFRDERSFEIIHVKE